MINGGFNKFHDYDFEKSHELPSGKRLHNYGKSQFFMGKLTVNGIFNSYVELPEGSLYCTQRSMTGWQDVPVIVKHG